MLEKSKTFAMAKKLKKKLSTLAKISEIFVQNQRKIADNCKNEGKISKIFNSELSKNRNDLISLDP